VFKHAEDDVDLHVTATGSDVQIVPAGAQTYLGLTFSPDGNFIDYVRAEKQLIEYRSLYQIPVLGGAPRKLVSDIDTAVTFSPDGKEFAFVRADPDHGQFHLMVANADGSSVHPLATKKAPEAFLCDLGYVQPSRRMAKLSWQALERPSPTNTVPSRWMFPPGRSTISAPGAGSLCASWPGCRMAGAC